MSEDFLATSKQLFWIENEFMSTPYMQRPIKLVMGPWATLFVGPLPSNVTEETRQQSNAVTHFE